MAEALQECGMAKLECSNDVCEGHRLTVPQGKLCFNFKRIKKKEVYQAFLDIYAHGGVEMDNQELVGFLATHTNLGSMSSIKTLFYRYKQLIHV